LLIHPKQQHRLTLIQGQAKILMKSLFSFIRTLKHHAISKKEECCEKSKA
jgi:hypothetical protein